MSHEETWIRSMLKGLDKEVDEKTRVRILENCGRDCISSIVHTHPLLEKAKSLKKVSKSNKEFLEKLNHPVGLSRDRWSVGDQSQPCTS